MAAFMWNQVKIGCRVMEGAGIQCSPFVTVIYPEKSVVPLPDAHNESSANLARRSWNGLTIELLCKVRALTIFRGDVGGGCGNRRFYDMLVPIIRIINSMRGFNKDEFSSPLRDIKNGAGALRREPFVAVL